MQNSACVPPSFRITSLENGWLFAKLALSGCEIELANSYLGGLELPGALIRMCNDFLSGAVSSQWLCWHGESHAVVWHLEKEQELLCLKIYRLGSSFGLPVCGEGLAQKVQTKEPERSDDFDTLAFAQTVFYAFREYRFGDRLAQWQGSEFKDHFPDAEYRVLRKLLRSGTG